MHLHSWAAAESTLTLFLVYIRSVHPSLSTSNGSISVTTGPYQWKFHSHNNEWTRQQSKNMIQKLFPAKVWLSGYVDRVITLSFPCVFPSQPGMKTSTWKCRLPCQHRKYDSSVLCEWNFHGYGPVVAEIASFEVGREGVHSVYIPEKVSRYFLWRLMYHHGVCASAPSRY